MRDNDNGKRLHFTLNSYDRKALEFVRNKTNSSMSASAALRVCIRAAALQLGFNGPRDASDEIYGK